MIRPKQIFKVIGIILSLWVIYQGICYGYWFLKMVSKPASHEIEGKFSTMSSEELVSALYNFDIFSPYPNTAMKMLGERKEQKAVPHLVKFLNSWHRGKRFFAIRALVQINDPRAIEPLMKIVRKTSVDTNKYNKELPPFEYFEALTSLAKMKYEGVYHYAVEFATLDKSRSRFFKGQAITMLKYFEKPESIPLLKKIADEHSEWTLHDGALEAIKHIESSKVK